MLFDYESNDFEILRKALYKLFISQDLFSYAPENSQELKKLFTEILDKDNTIELSKLDHNNLLYNSWDDINKALNSNYLSQDNALLYEIYKNESPTQSQIHNIYTSLLLVLYADFYEASLVLDNEDDRFYFKELSNRLLYLSGNISDINLKKLNFLWMEIPRNIFDKHLGNHLDKNVLETVDSLRNNQNFIQDKITSINILKKDVEEIEKSLNDQKREYNFVGLSDGFSKLRETKENELKNEKETYRNLMWTIIAIIFIKTVGSLIYLWTNDPINLIFIAITVSTIFFLFILLYFFRISLVNIKSIKSQILQIDLRLTLCQFIHNYETDTTKLRSKDMKESFDKFESVIFAPIVATEDQMPSTFDGLEQLTGLLSSFNKGSK